MPSIHHQLEHNLRLNATKEKVGMIFKPCVEFADFLANSNRKDLRKTLVEEATEQSA
jgi:hypothetical protein